MKTLADIYNFNANEGCEYDFGIVFYIINRLSFVVFNDLMCYKFNMNNSLLYPSLQYLFKFLYNFSVYIQVLQVKILNMINYFILKNMIY